MTVPLADGYTTEVRRQPPLGPLRPRSWWYWSATWNFDWCLPRSANAQRRSQARFATEAEAILAAGQRGAVTVQRTRYSEGAEGSLEMDPSGVAEIDAAGITVVPFTPNTGAVSL